MEIESESARLLANKYWSGKTAEERSALGRERFLTASVTTIERRAADLTDDQVERLRTALERD
jgi:hypothetical protein